MNKATLSKFRNKPSGSLNYARRWAIAATLAGIFAIGFSGAVASASPLPQTEPEQAPTVKERVMAMPPHTMVQVRLHNKNIQGRVRIATRKGFVLQVAADGKNQNEKISYDDVQSIQPIKGNGASFSIHFVIDGGSGNAVDVQIDH